MRNQILQIGYIDLWLDIIAATVHQIRKVLENAFLGEAVEVEILTTESLPVSQTGKLQLVSREF